MTDNRYGDQPLGKSVEDIEAEGGNRVNSPVPGEARRDLEADAALLPAVVGSGGGGGSAVPAIVNPDLLVEGGSGPVDHTDPAPEEGRGLLDGDEVNRPMPDRDRGTSER